MSKAILLFVIAAFFAEPGFAQAPRSSTSTSTAMEKLLREVATYPRDDDQIRRTLALVVLSAMRLEDLERTGSSDTASFRTVFDKQLRTARGCLNLMGTDSLDTVRRDLADNLQRSFGAAPLPFEQFMSAVADRERRGTESGPHIRDTVRAAIQAMMSVQDPARQLSVSRLLVEAAAVVRLFGDDPLALEGIRKDLAIQAQKS